MLTTSRVLFTEVATCRGPDKEVEISTLEVASKPRCRHFAIGIAIGLPTTRSPSINEHIWHYAHTSKMPYSVILACQK
jgi:hypothetical protein